jgi:hypothetical protein
MSKNSCISQDSCVCYICQEESEAISLFCEKNICKCKGTNRIHEHCFQKLRNQDICSICKSQFENVQHLIIEEPLEIEKVLEKDPFGWRHEYNIDQKGRKQGIHRIYYMNGTLWEETQYKNDKKNGYQKVWNYKGKLFVNDVYKNGILSK